MTNNIILGNTTMQITESKVCIKDFVEGYYNGDYELCDESKGVTTMNGQLIIRPSYQRNYVRMNDQKWKEALIKSILKGYPIALMYWAENDNNTLEVVDGQQRGITICDFYTGRFDITIDGAKKSFSRLPNEYKEKFLNYKLDVHKCKGSEEDKIDWFGIINQPISVLYPQELRNACCVGMWLESAKRYFSAPTANTKGKEVNDYTTRYCAGRYAEKPSIERQEILEIALDWASYQVYPTLKKDERIEKYMFDHKNDENANELISTYKTIIDWIWATFLDFENPNENDHTNTHCHKECKGTPHSMARVDWGKLYYNYCEKSKSMDTKYLTKRVEELLSDGDIVRYDGVYEYLLNDETEEAMRFIQIRAFATDDKKKMFKMQGGISPLSGEKCNIKDMVAHHIVAWKNGGKTEIENGILLSKEDHEKIHNGAANSVEVLNMRNKLWEQNDPKEYAKYVALQEIEKRFA